MALLPAAALAQPGWPDHVVPLLRACLEEAGPTAFATGVAPARPGGWRILLHEGGATTACILRDGAVTARLAVPDAPPPDPAAPAFFLGRRCVDARRVDAPDGRVLGWLAYPGC